MEEKIIECYENMYQGMILKDKVILDTCLDDSFVLTHMTGMRQSKKEFIHCILDGNLNYYTVCHEHYDIQMNKDIAILIGQSVVEAAVFGGGKGSWHLQQKIILKKANHHWVMIDSHASTY